MPAPCKYPEDNKQTNKQKIDVKNHNKRLRYTIRTTDLLIATKNCKKKSCRDWPLSNAMTCITWLLCFLTCIIYRIAPHSLDLCFYPTFKCKYATVIGSHGSHKKNKTTKTIPRANDDRSCCCCCSCCWVLVLHFVFIGVRHRTNCSPNLMWSLHRMGWVFATGLLLALGLHCALFEEFNTTILLERPWSRVWRCALMEDQHSSIVRQ